MAPKGIQYKEQGRADSEAGTYESIGRYRIIPVFVSLLDIFRSAIFGRCKVQ